MLGIGLGIGVVAIITNAFNFFFLDFLVLFPFWTFQSFISDMYYGVAKGMGGGQWGGGWIWRGGQLGGWVSE